MGKEIESSSIRDEMEKWMSTQSPAESTKMPLLSLNHVSFVCSSLKKSIKFYVDVLGFVMIKRPSSFDFEGAWLFSNGIGIHLLESDKQASSNSKKTKINPKDNHISFQCTDMDLIITRLKQNNLEYVTAVVEEGGIVVDQLFFHDPDGYMVEICNCHVLPILPLSVCPLKKMPSRSPAPDAESWKQHYGSDETQMMVDLAIDMMVISF